MKALEKELTDKREENHELLDQLRQTIKNLKKLRDAYQKIERYIAQKMLKKNA